MKCSHCGFEDEGKYCSNCGKLIHINSNLPVEAPWQEANDWYVSISFGQSTSKNFSKALAMAKAAPQYIEGTDEFGNPIYQAIYGPKEYLKFIALYELIGQWKSTFVFINGEMVDRKIIGNINYCYGDKLRSGKSDFCFGASFWTKNPFGCHRAQIHYGNDPWYSFGNMDNFGVFHVDIDRIIQELKRRLEPYKYCPGLDMNDVLARAASLPKTINPQKQPEWEYTTRYSADGTQTLGVQPKGASLGISYEIEISLNDLLDNKQDNKRTIDDPKKEIGATNNNAGCLSGCLLVIAMLLIIGLSLL